MTIPFAGVPLGEHRSLLEALPDLGYTDVWAGEAAGYDGFTPLTLAAAWAPRLRVGTAVLPVQTRGPALLAMTAATLAEVAGGGVALGIGSSGRPFVERINGIPFDEPYKRVRDTARFLRSALAGLPVAGRFDTFDIEGFTLMNPPRHRVPVLVGALRPGMLRLAATEADGAVVNLVAAVDVPRLLEAQGSTGHGKELVARITVLPTRDRAVARHLGRRMLAPMLNAATYSAAQDWLGRTEQLAGMRAAWARGDWLAAAASIPDEVVDDLIVHGSPDECLDHIQRFVRAGVTTPLLVVQPTPEHGVGARGMLQALRELAPGR